jgi:nitrous oxidase accessory protein NosD
MKRLARVTLAAAAFFAFAGVSPAFATTKVDDDGAQCPDAQFTSISAAVAAAAPGESIEVCAGVYNESVVVDKRLSLKGWTQKLDGGDCLDRSRGIDPSKDTLVQGGLLGPGFWVQANEVEITNFTVQLATNPGNGVGIYLSNAFSKYRIKENLVQDNVFGIYLNSNGVEESQVEVNCVRDNNEPGSASGNGVYSDQGVRHATVKDNTFTGHTNASVIFVGRPGTQSHLQIEAKRIARRRAVHLRECDAVDGEEQREPQLVRQRHLLRRRFE